MPTCKRCHSKWSWKQTVIKTFSLSPKMTCPYCEKEQYQSNKSKTNISFLGLIVLLPLLINALFNVPVSILLGLISILFLFVLGVYPFFIELSSKEEFPF